MTDKAARKILVIGPSWVGDMVMAQSLFICLHQRHAELQLDVLAPAWCRELICHMPEVNEALPMPVGHGELALGKRRALGRQLGTANYDQAIVLPNSFKSALIPWFAGIPLRTGWRGEMRGWLLNDCRVLDRQRYPLMVQRFAALAWPPGSQLPEPLPAPVLAPRQEHAAGLRNRLGLHSNRPVLVLCPGAEFGPAKQWPQQHYAEVAQHYIGKGMQVWLLGSAKDSTVAEGIRTGLPPEVQVNCHSLCGSTTLGDAITLMHESAAVVSNDSGLMHVAAALGKPQVVVYGSTSPGFTPPLSVQARTLSLDLPCSPCFKRQCPLQHLDCLRKLMPDQVVRALDGMLDVGVAGRILQ